MFLPVQLPEGARGHQLPAQPIIFFLGAIAPVDGSRLAERGDFIHPGEQGGMGRGSGSGHGRTGMVNEAWLYGKSAGAIPQVQSNFEAVRGRHALGGRVRRR